jgi:phosphohistidine phosphatase
MPRLFLLRHATAERARPGEKDHDRPLTKGGRKEAAAIGKTVAELGANLVLSSTSSRTRETWDGVAEAFGKKKPEVRFLRALYEPESTYLPIIRAEGGEAEGILVVGHNPAIQETAIELAADLASRDGRKLAARFPKAGLAVFEFDGAWRSLQPHAVRLTDFVEPDGR